MYLFKKFRFHITLLSALVIGATAFVIWGSSDVFSPVITELSVQAKSTSKESLKASTSENHVPSHFPAPAKKLHQLISDANTPQSDTEALDEKVHQLNDQLAAINEQLDAKGIDASTQQSNDNSSPSNTPNRLKAIKQHIQNKNRQKTKN